MPLPANTADQPLCFVDRAAHYRYWYQRSVLLWMKTEWRRCVAEHKKHAGQSCGGCLYKLNFEYELADQVSKGIDQLHKDWYILNMLMEAMHRWSDAAELLQQSGKYSVLQRIDNRYYEMDGYLFARHRGQKYVFNKSKQFSISVSKCRRKTDALLKEEIIGGTTLEHISSLALKARCSDKLGELIIDMESMMEEEEEDGFHSRHLHIICDELKLIRKYLIEVKRGSLSSELVDNQAFVAHVSSVMVKIVNHWCDFWFNRKDANIARVKALGVVNLQRQIDPSSPEFMMLILEFQEFVYHALYKRASGYERSREAMGCFITYILNRCSNRDTGTQLMSLVTHFFTALRRHYHQEDVKCLFSEMQVLLAEAAILHRVRQDNGSDHRHSCSYLLDKICILEAESFLKEQLISTNTSSMPFSENQTVKVVDILKNLRRATADLCQRMEAEYGEHNSILNRELDGEVLSLYESLQSKKMTDYLMKHMLHQLVFKIVFFKAESFLSDLSTSQTAKSFMDNEKDQIESFMMELKHLKQLVSNQLLWNLGDREIIIFMHVEAVVRKASFLTYSFLSDNDKFEKALLLLPDWLSEVKDIKTKLVEVSSPIISSSFPKTFKLGFIDFLGRNIQEVLKYDQESIRPVNNLLKKAQSYLDSFKSILMKGSDPNPLKGGLNDICMHFMDLAYKLEYVIESIEIDACLGHSLRLYDLLEDIRLVDEQVSKFSETSSTCELKDPPASGVSFKVLSKDTKLAASNMNVDLVDEEKNIMNLLTRGSSQRAVVSIVGMPGIGKTTLAEKVYNDKNVICHFPRRAWCNVSQLYSKRDLLLDLLSGVQLKLDEFHGMSDDDLQSKLRRGLLGSRYFIVLDDIWDTSAWDGIQSSFPDDNNGSRILITSRLCDVHSVVDPGSDPYLIRPLTDEESWRLLEKKIFKGLDCPNELMILGKKISKHCQGFPLAVVAVAGLLQTEKTRSWWEKISNIINSQLMIDPSPENRCKEILELSYKHLPEYLKPCFLYMGGFLRDREIPVNKLVQFWMAEGFLEKNESKSLEVVAHNYLMELINRSLVIISKTRSDGGVKTCRLHDLLRDLCHSKARDDNFLHLVTRDDEPYASFPDSEYDMQFHRHKLEPVTFESYRLSIFLRRNHFIDSKPSGPRTRSLIFFASADKEPRCPYEISLVLNNFKLLRVLHLECINMGVSFPAEIGQMVQLRYLALSGYMQSVPSSIANLWKLQILVVRGFRGTVILPSAIWSMASLRHLLVNEHVCFDLEDCEDGESSSCLENLVSFSTPSLSFGDKTINILRRFPNLLKMKCIFLESLESLKSCNEFPVLDFLSQLESLKIMYHGRAIDAGEFILPLSLKKLTLSNFRLPWKHISRIGDLPNLKVLKLLSGAFDGPIWEMKENEFKKLEFLKLEALNVAEWIVSEDPLPSLKRLVVQNCKDLEKIPQDFACISTLEVIEVQWCTKALEESAEKIGDETEGVNVVIAYN